MSLFRHARWSDNDRYFGPFTYVRKKSANDYCPLAFVLNSGDDDENEGCTLRMSGFGHTLIITLPPIIRPHREKVKIKFLSPEQIERLGRDWYYDIDEREYGFSYFENHFSIYYGRQSNSSDTTMSWGFFPPWTEWTHVRDTFYDLKGEPHATVRKDENTHQRYFDKSRSIKESCPFRVFTFTDYDGEQLAAKTIIEESEWRFGSGKFWWLSWFKKPRIVKTLRIDFSGEVGRKKGSYKGGTLGHGIDMKQGELHEEAFRRYCLERDLKFNERFTSKLDDYARSLRAIPTCWLGEDDSSNSLECFMSVVNRLGFVEVLTEQIGSSSGKVNIYAQRRDGLLLRFTSGGDVIVSDVGLYYNWHPYDFTLYPVTKGYLCDVIHYTQPIGVWCGSFTSHVGLLRKIAELRTHGYFVTPWISSPKHFRLWESMEDRDALALRIAKLPDWVQENITTVLNDVETNT